MRQGRRVLILGGGPAGLGAAYWLAGRGFDTTLVEARERVGGNAGSFELDGVPVDYGSHRLHPATDPEILAELKSLMGKELVERPRHGRILLAGRWIHFPLKPLDMLGSAPPAFLLGAARDALTRLLPWGPREGRRVSEGARGRKPGQAGDDDSGAGASFASVLLEGLGPTICRDFYFPFARKLWGLDPEEISPVQARRRVGSRSMGALIRRLLPRGKGGSSGGGGIFYYPRGGFGRISEALREGAEGRGARIILNAPVRGIGLAPDGGATLRTGPDEVPDTLSGDHLWSTLPLRLLAKIMDPPPPAGILDAARKLETRAMILVYLVLEARRFSEFDAHYFPAPEIPFSRLSEPKNYSGREDPGHRTVLCAEIPCSREDPIWEANEESLGERVRDGLARAGIPLEHPLLRVVAHRLPAAYPVYRTGYEHHFRVVDDWLKEIPNLLTFGRQGLFAHDNTHHALAMARAAAHCLDDDGAFRREVWDRYRETFRAHVVQD